jgi:hypothetical protein
MVLTGNNLLERINGADHAHGAFVQDMGVNHSGLDVGVAKKFLHCADVLAGFQQMGGETVPKAVRRETNRQPALPNGLLHGTRPVHIRTNSGNRFPINSR